MFSWQNEGNGQVSWPSAEDRETEKIHLSYTLKLLSVSLDIDIMLKKTSS